MRKNNKEQSSVEELKNKEKLLFFVTSPIFKKIEEDFLPLKVAYLNASKSSDPDVSKHGLDKFDDVSDYLEQVLRENNLPINFKQSLLTYFFSGKKIEPKKRNFTIRIDPPIRQAREDKTDRSHFIDKSNYTDTVNLITYAPLSTKEWATAYKHLKYFWKEFLPPSVSRRTNLRDKDVDKKFVLEKEMGDRRYRTEYAEDNYLSIVRKSSGENAYKSAKKLNPKLTTIKSEKNTSKDIARKVYGTTNKAGAARVAFSRLKKRRNSPK